jgi:predicted membrane-bound spermidine synthase
MLLPYATIFVTGGATLAMELLASRVMTPYFGVSLYIWTGILSITLVALALGYAWGGRLAARYVARGRAERLQTAFALMPPLSALSLVVVCVVYPHVFPRLAAMDLVAGAFIACLLMLGVPLVTTSAMNPLLIAMRMHARRPGDRAADAGAGGVFFTSTVGSVAGVVATAFWLIPNFSNFVALLIVALCLSLLPLAALRRQAQPVPGRRALGVVTGIAVAAAAGLLWQADNYLGRMWPAQHAGVNWSIEASVSSHFGTVKVLRSEPIDDKGLFVRVYFQDGLIQNRMYSDGRSFSLYTYALESLSTMYRPHARSALVLGMGAGVVPNRLADYGMKVTAVDIDPAAFVVAKRFFGHDERRIEGVQADARTYLRGCTARHDIVVVDLFHGDGTPEYLVTRDFFADLRRCLTPTGVAVFNTFADLDLPLPYAHFLTTLRAEFQHVVLHREDDREARQINSFVVASAGPLEPGPPRLDDVPAIYAEDLQRLHAHPRQLDRSLTEGGQVITDARSAAAADLARVQMAYRRDVVKTLPPAFLVN